MEQKTGLSLMVYALICRKCAANVSTRPFADSQPISLNFRIEDIRCQRSNPSFTWGSVLLKSDDQEIRRRQGGYSGERDDIHLRPRPIAVGIIRQGASGGVIDQVIVGIQGFCSRP